MKCEKCGKREANYYYSSNINGNVTEKHLCSECANEIGADRDFFSGMDRMFEDMFEGFFGRSGLLSPSRGFSFSMPTMLMPRIEFRLDDGSIGAGAPAPELKTGEKIDVDPEMQKRRELNMLREQMKSAVEKEDFEKAAEIRDKIRELEK
ncbi:MAG: UvrB/UvrC motif-containing protein [Oscillospiraceae bacterium]